MAVVSRSKDQSERREVLGWRNHQVVTAGETGVISYVPYPCVLKAANIACLDNPSNALNILLSVQRFIVGTGVTNILLGSTFAPPIFGTSGVIPSGISLPASGNAALNLIPGDVISYLAAGGSSAYINGLVGQFVIEPVQDIRVFLGGLA